MIFIPEKSVHRFETESYEQGFRAGYWALAAAAAVVLFFTRKKEDKHGTNS